MSMRSGMGQYHSPLSELRFAALANCRVQRDLFVEESLGNGQRGRLHAVLQEPVAQRISVGVTSTERADSQRAVLPTLEIVTRPPRSPLFKTVPPFSRQSYRAGPERSC